MSVSPWSRSVALVAVVLALVVGTAAAIPAGPALVVADADTGEQLLVQPVRENTTVALEYTHSVERSRVLDAYVVRDGQFVMTRMEFESYGAGLPSRANVTRENGTFAFDPEMSTDELYVKPGRIAGHKLHVGKQTYDLVALSNAESVRLTVTRRSALDAALSQLP